MTVKQQEGRARFMTATKFYYQVPPATKVVNSQRALLFPKTDSLGNTYFASGSNILTGNNINRQVSGRPLDPLVRPPFDFPDIFIIAGGWSISPDFLQIRVGWDSNATTSRFEILMTPAGIMPTVLEYHNSMRVAVVIPTSRDVLIDMLPIYIELFGVTAWEVGMQIRFSLSVIHGASGQRSQPVYFQLGLAP